MKDNDSPDALAVLPTKPNGILNVMGEVDKSDLIAVAAVRFERTLETGKKAISEEIGELNKAIEDGEERLQKDCATAAQEYDLHAEQDLVKALKTSGFGAFEAQTQLQSLDENKQSMTLQVKIHHKNDHSYYGANLEKQLAVSFSAEAKAILKNLRNLRAQLTAQQTKLAEIHKKLANLGRIEREARARLAETALASTKDGQAILDQLMSVGDSNLPKFLLPAGE